MTRVLVCGGRDFNDRDILFAALDAVDKDHTITMLIHGGAPGADKLAGEWAKDRIVPHTIFRADWRKHGRAAGPLRNQQMIEDGPELVVAFPGGKGTRDMVERAEDAGVPVMRIAP